MQDKLDYFNERVWVSVPASAVYKDPEAKVIGTRLVISNTSEANTLDVRARLAAQAVGHFDDVSFYAATPPLDAMRP